MATKTPPQQKVAKQKQAKPLKPGALPFNVFDLVADFHGYRNKEDITNLPSGYLVAPSKNVYTLTSGLVASRPGYSILGQSGTATTPVQGSFDWHRHTGGERNVRTVNGKIQLLYTAAAGDKWKTNTFTAGQNFWIDLLTGSASDYWNFCTFWDTNTEKIDFLLGVNRTANIYEWSGGLTTIASTSNTAISFVGNNALLTSASAASSNSAQTFYWNALAGTSFNGSLVFTANPTNGDTLTLTLNGTAITITFVSVIGANPGNVLIGANTAATITNLLGLLQSPGTTNANQVALSGGNQTLVGYITYANTNTITTTGTSTWAQLAFYLNGTRQVTINGNVYTYTGGEATLTLFGMADPTGEANQSVIFQTIRVTTNAAMSLALAQNDLISNLNNQIYVASLSDFSVYVSNINNYKSFTFTSPTRKPGEGAKLTLDGAITGFAPRDSAMDISAGKDFWFETVFTLSSDLVSESLTVKKLKTAPLQGSLSQGLICNYGNDVAFVTNEPTISTLGWIEQVYQTPQIANIGDPIKSDIDGYTTTGFTDGHSVYNKYFLYISVPQKGVVRIFNSAKNWWEAPWTLPIGRFSIINGNLVGHSYLTDESYTLYSGTSDNGNPIDSVAAFSYETFGTRAGLKKFREFYIEGYISPNTILNLTTKLDFGGFTSSPIYAINGQGVGSGKNGIFQTITDNSLGKIPLGEFPLGSITDSVLNLPKFRMIKTGVPTNFFEYQPFFESNNIDQQWAILAFGPRLEHGDEPNYIKD